MFLLFLKRATADNFFKIPWVIAPECKKKLREFFFYKHRRFAEYESILLDALSWQKYSETIITISVSAFIQISLQPHAVR